MNKLSFSSFANLRPFQFFGDISYSLYLWHWVVIVLYSRIFFDGKWLPLNDKLIYCIPFSIVFAAISYYFIERLFTGKLGRISKQMVSAKFTAVFITAAIAVLMVVAPTVANYLSITGNIEKASSELYIATDKALNAEEEYQTDGIVESTQTLCFGAIAVEHPAVCQDFFGKADDTYIAASPRDGLATNALRDHQSELMPRNCSSQTIDSFGDTNGAKKVLVIGDSHACMLSAGFDIAGKRTNTEVLFAASAGCILNTIPGDIDGALVYDCSEMVANIKALSKSDLDAVIFTENFGERSVLGSDAFVKNMKELLNDFLDAGVETYILGDVPLTNEPNTAFRSRNPIQCLLSNQSVQNCKIPRAHALQYNSLPTTLFADEIERGVQFVDSSSRYCDENYCYLAIGGISVFGDEDHITGAYSATLSSWLTEAVLE